MLRERFPENVDKRVKPPRGILFPFEAFGLHFYQFY
jgi:hypothetical protein